MKWIIKGMQWFAVEFCEANFPLRKYLCISCQPFLTLSNNFSSHWHISKIWQVSPRSTGWLAVETPNSSCASTFLSFVSLLFVTVCILDLRLQMLHISTIFRWQLSIYSRSKSNNRNYKSLSMTKYKPLTQDSNYSCQISKNILYEIK